MYFVYFLGTAGSGKSTMTKVFGEWLEDHEMSACRVNLDPAVKQLPYFAEVDVRRYVDYNELLESGLGPNGAMVKSVDLILQHATTLRKEIEECLSNYVLVDTPGQIELFAYRKVTLELLRELSGGDKSAIVYLIDSTILSKEENQLDPYAFASLAVLGASLKIRFRLPQVNVINKVDLLSMEQRFQLDAWLEDMRSIAYSVGGEEGTLTIRLIEAIEDSGGIGEMLVSSAVTEEGLDSLYAALQRSFYGGEDYATEEPSARL
ncbi:ATP-binding protein [Ignicoccus pacificus DSM 13166]|uniref:ATP-binding protein n=1 Tax=Ignicoccus pacificus DSM 13166 TaxID=940294 RepID=A0A977K8X7_9CREN|nr:ATP-binding protein [Ignicoccus pacificus DSM 13166]